MIEQIDTIASTIASGLLIVLAIPFAMTVWRLLIGPSHADRFVALDMLTGLAISLAALTSVVAGRREFLDVALGLAVFGFIGTCALAIFLEKNNKEDPQ